MNTEWKPIESAPQTGRTLLLGYWNSHGKWRTVRGQWMSLEYIAEHWEDPDDAEAGWFETAVEADDAPNCWPVSPSHWQPMPAAPCQTCNGHGAVGNILNAEPCPDCSPAPTSHPIPTGATGEDERKQMAHKAIQWATPSNVMAAPLVACEHIRGMASLVLSAPAAGDELDLVSLLNIRFTPVSEGLPDLVEYSPSYAGQWSSKWCAVITARGNIESSQFVLPSSEKEALEAARFNGVWRSGMSPSRVVAWAYMDHIRSAAEAAAIAQQSQRKEA